MFREVIKTKIKNLEITDTIKSDENIIVIDADIIDLIDVIEDEIIHIFNVAKGYSKDVAVKRAPRGSGIVCLYVSDDTDNNSDDDCMKVGNTITLLAYQYVETRLINQYKMTSIDYQNKNIKY